MYSAADELPNHVSVDPGGPNGADHPGWTDRYYFSCFAPDGSVVLEFGVGVFPKTKLVEAWSCSVVRDEKRYFQVNVRPSTHYDTTPPWPLRAGPLSFEMLEASRRWRIVLDENPYGSAFELELDWLGDLFEADPVLVKGRDGRPVTHTAHYVQMGGGRGRARIAGEEFRLDGLVAFRDRSWGLRSPGEGGPQRGLLNWVPVRFGDAGFCYYNIEREDGRTAYMSGGMLGSEAGPGTRITAIEHDLEFETGTRIFREGRVNFTLENGRTCDVGVKKLAALYLRGGGYFTGGHGVARAGDHLDGERWDLTSLARQEALLALNDNISEFRLADGRVGYGVFELAMGSFDRYGFARQ